MRDIALEELRAARQRQSTPRGPSACMQAAAGNRWLADAFFEHAAMFKGAGPRVSAVDSLSHQIREIISRHLNVAPEKIADSSRIIKDLGADSLDTIELIIAFEEVFGCEIPDEVAESIATVSDAKKYLETRVKL